MRDNAIINVACNHFNFKIVKQVSTGYCTQPVAFQTDHQIHLILSITNSMLMCNWNGKRLKTTEIHSSTKLAIIFKHIRNNNGKYFNQNHLKNRENQRPSGQI